MPSQESGKISAAWRARELVAYVVVLTLVGWQFYAGLVSLTAAPTFRGGPDAAARFVRDDAARVDEALGDRAVIYRALIRHAGEGAVVVAHAPPTPAAMQLVTSLRNLAYPRLVVPTATAFELLAAGRLDRPAGTFVLDLDPESPLRLEGTELLEQGDGFLLYRFRP
ncbi:MAG: hypothetical protein O3B85_08285 [Planctomycetota bacterium]|nr:hypothetical protein [Planctomycetota bacterium]